MADAVPDFTPVNLLTGFLGSGKTTLLARLLADPALADTAVLINEFGEVGLDHHLLERIDEGVVLLQSGCLCCTIRGELSQAIRDLHSKRERGLVPAFDRLVVESTGLADPFPILSTIKADPVLRHHFRPGNVVTTVDAVNGLAQLAGHPESTRQAAAADRLVITKTDLADEVTAARLAAALRRLNPAAPVLHAAAAPSADDLLGRDMAAAAGGAVSGRAWFAETFRADDAEAGAPRPWAARSQQPSRPHRLVLGRRRRADRLDRLRRLALDAAQPARRPGAAREGHPGARRRGSAGRDPRRPPPRPYARTHGRLAER